MSGQRAANRWRLRCAAWLLAAAFSIALIGLGAALTCRPAAYRPAATDYSRLDSDQRDLVSLVDRIGAGLNRSQSVELRLTAEQVNRWIAARGELALPRGWSLPAGLRPCVEFRDDGRVWVGTLIQRGWLSAVLSAELAFEIEPEHVEVHVLSAKVGIVPLPAGWLIAAAGLAPDGGSFEWHESPPLGRFRNDFLWENGRRRGRVAAIEVTAGNLRITLAPR